MKKFFLLSLAAFSAASAYPQDSAQTDVIYVNGDESQTVNGTKCPGWTITDPIAIPLENGVFTIKVENFSNFHISTQKSANGVTDWNTDWNPNQLSIEDATLQPCVEMNLIKSTAGFDNNNAWNFTGGNFTFVVAGDLKTVKALPDRIYLAGENGTVVNGVTLGGWIINPPAIVEKGDDGDFHFSIIPAPNGNVSNQNISIFKNGDDWGVWGAGKYWAAIVNEGVATPLNHSDGNTTYPCISRYYNVTVSGDMSTITATPETPEDAVVFLVGDFNGWTMDVNDTKWQFHKEDGKYVIDTEIPGNTPFKISARSWELSPVYYTYGAQIDATDMGSDMTWQWGTADNTTLADDFKGKITLTPEPVEPGKARTANVMMVRDMNVGVGIVSAETGQTEYYNLQGLRVDHPVKGNLYIMKRSSRSQKVIFK